MKISNSIEIFINQLIRAQDGVIEIKRNELASEFNCAPSQINYVINTRFSPERGYIVESRRGGGGYIKISLIQHKTGNYIMHVINSIGDAIGYGDAKAFIQNFFDYDILTENEAKIILAGITDKSINILPPERDMVRARIMKNILLSL